MAEPTLAETDVLRLRRLLGDSHGIDLSYYTESFLTRRVAARMRQLGAATPADYLTRLAGDEDEVRALVAALTVNVTEFFRDAAVYEALRKDVLPKILAGGRKRVVAWSAGCATGQEAYTLAMTLDEALQARPGCSYTVYASDINPRQLEAAAAASYPAEAVKLVPARYGRRYFVSEPGDRVSILPALKSNVRFFRHDLSSGQPIPAAGFDLILCRNVMIYFAAEAKPKVFETFHGLMNPEAFLILGGTEVILNNPLFRSIDAANKIYRAVPRPAAGGR
jgi:chemotaxis methyl-accepting protein methylase